MSDHQLARDLAAETAWPDQNLQQENNGIDWDLRPDQFIIKIRSEP